MSDFKISIIIPCYNKWNFTKSALNDLKNLPGDHEVIVVDDGGTDETEKEILKFKSQVRRSLPYQGIARRALLSETGSYDKEIDMSAMKGVAHPSLTFKFGCLKYIKKDKNEGFGKAVSEGFKHASADIIMILNNDIRVQKDHANWTDNIIKFLSHNERYLVGPTGGYITPDTFDFMYETNDPARKINYMSGWCLAARRSVWDELRHDENYVFDPDFRMYYEDTSLSFKATKLGIKFKLIDVPLTHFKKQSSDKSQVSKLYQESRKIFASKWGKK